MWNEWCTEYIDLPNLKSIELGNIAFTDSLSTIMESMFWLINRNEM